MDQDSNKSSNDLPRAGAGDAAHTLVKAGLSAIPFAGGPASELFNAIIAPPLSKRRDKWLIELADALRTLEARVEDLHVDELGSNDAFVTTVIHASQIAIKNHQLEKIEALRNAVLNAALSTDPGEDLLLVFLGLVDTLTVLHLRILDVLHDPEKWFEQVRSDLPEEIHREGVTEMYAYPTELVLPQFEQRRTMYEQLVRDLHSRGLVERGDISSIAGMRKEGRAYVRFSLRQESGATDMGREFMRFISDPLLTASAR